MKKRTLFLLLGALALIALILILTLPGGEKTPVSDKNAENFGALLSDLVNAYENPAEESQQVIETDLKAIRSVSRRDYQLAKSIADHWESVFLDENYPLYLYHGDPMAPELADAGIPDSSDHAIVVLGYELMDGEMQPELVGRCETAAAVARAYPKTIIVCSGGATGDNNPEHHTEAGLIKAYLVDNCGIEASRIFTDEEAMTTAENAVNTFRILQEKGVHSMTIVTSVYHMRWGQAVYHLLAELYSREQRYEIRSIANYCYDVEPTVEMYRAGNRIAAFQIAGILELPEEVIRSLPSFFPSGKPGNNDRPAEPGIDYLALVNKLNALPDGWEDALETVTVTNSVGDEVEVEAKAYKAYERLKADLEENDGVYLELDSARRSVAAQQDIMDRFTEKYGADYAAKTVAQPGYSEHHTGLALDLYFKLMNDDGSFTDVYYNEDMVQYPEIWAKIHAKLAEYGFILRYLEGREHITGYGYEPWHIRYLDNPDIAAEIMDADITLEEYLAGEKAPELTIDYGASALYTKEDLDEAIVQIKCRFAGFGCELHSISYAGDGANNAENLAWMNELDPGKGYTQVCEFLSDFHTPADAEGAWEPDTEYTSWQWWLARTEDGGWQLLTFGY